jgi:hypothetical protein
MEEKYQYDLSETEIMERGQRLAVVLGRLELHKEEQKITNAETNAKIKGLRQEAHILSLAIREGHEYRDVYEQQEMEMILAECGTCLHQKRFTFGTLLDDKPCVNCGLIGSLKEKK